MSHPPDLDGASDRTQFLVKASFLQICDDVISDLLSDATNLRVREGKGLGVYAEGLSDWVLRSTDETLKLLRRGDANRAVEATSLNAVSNRGHVIFTVVVEQEQKGMMGCSAAHLHQTSRAGRCG